MSALQIVAWSVVALLFAVGFVSLFIDEDVP